ncbi:MAG: hypothetical protein ACQSGP_29230, partial [Frankia sp.]
MPSEVGRTQVGIVGAEPAGLLLSHLLHLTGAKGMNLAVADVRLLSRAGWGLEPAPTPGPARRPHPPPAAPGR